MNESTLQNESSPVSERTPSQSETPVFGIPLSRRQTVLLIGLVVFLAVVLWRRRINQNRSQQASESVESEKKRNEQSAEEDGEKIYVPQDPDDELEKDAVVIDALRSRGKMGAD